MADRFETQALREKGMCGHIFTSTEASTGRQHELGCIQPIGHDGDVHEHLRPSCVDPPQRRLDALVEAVGGLLSVPLEFRQPVAVFAKLLDLRAAELEIRETRSDRACTDCGHQDLDECRTALLMNSRSIETIEEYAKRVLETLREVRAEERAKHVR
jgi:hypothetical protein